MNEDELTNFRNSKYRRELRNCIIQHYSLGELRILAHDLSTDWEELPGETKSLKVKELIDYFARRNLLQALNRQLQLDRPNVNWPGFPSGSMAQVDFEYKAAGRTQDGRPFEQAGKASIVRDIEGEYYDDGLAFAEAVNFTADHVYIFEVEKIGSMGISEFHVSIYNLEATIHFPETNTE
ncbi:MAG: hypothetical protein H6659_19740 [Ardenticatenaceae bacterium]|nr:hypothetical protein [Ardenticatenaceae bacterium]